MASDRVIEGRRLRVDVAFAACMTVLACASATACGGKVSADATEGGGSTDTGDEADAGWELPPFETGFHEDAVAPDLHVDPTCPPRARTPGSSCEGAIRCDYLRECRGVITMRCTAGRWIADGEPCADVCQRAVAGEPCPPSGSGRTCDVHLLASEMRCLDQLACDETWSRVGERSCDTSAAKDLCRTFESCPPTSAGCSDGCSWCVCLSTGQLECSHYGAKC